MYRTDKRSRLIGFAITTAMAGVLLAGCAAKTAPLASTSANKAEAAMAMGKHDQAIAHAEAAVLAEPRNAAYRAMLGGAYLDAGRFQSAAASFDDAMELGDESGRTALSLALALTADGKTPEALAVLDAAQKKIPGSDLGLAYTLAGQPRRGIDTLTVALRNGESTAKVRQNLAYSYALNGNWREARIMASQDVPADKVGNRMAEWAAASQPGADRQRVAALLGVPASQVDQGQPIQLALANFPSDTQLAYQAAQSASMPSVAVQDEPAPVAMTAAEPVELAPLGAAAPAAATPAKVAQANDFSSAFDTAAVPAQPAKPAAAVVSSATADGTHLVQLGSFSTDAGAQRAWGIYLKRYPELANHQMVISEAMVKGKRYYRVSAAGFQAGSAKSMCGKVRTKGNGCFAYAEDRPLPGAVDAGTRLASR